MSNKTKEAELKRKRRLEEKWQDTSARANIPEYNPLYDENLRRHYQNARIQKYLQQNGLIDSSGHLIDLEKNKAKMVIIEQEFARAEKEEALRLRDEERRRQQLRDQGLDPDAPENRRKSNRKARNEEQQHQEGEDEQRTDQKTEEPTVESEDKLDQEHDEQVQPEQEAKQEVEEENSDDVEPGITEEERMRRKTLKERVIDEAKRQVDKLEVKAKK